MNPRRSIVLAGAVVAAVSLAACSTSSTPAATSAPPSPSGSASSSPTSSTSFPPISPLDSRAVTTQQVPGEPDWVVVAGDAAWTAANGGLTRLDGRSGAPGATTPIKGTICLAMDVAYDSIWLATCDTPTLVRVSPVNGQVTATIPLPIDGVHEESSVAAGGGTGGVWVIDAAGNRIVRVNPSTNKPDRQFDVPEGSTAVRAAFGSLWVTDAQDDTLLRLDPRDGAVQATIPVGAGPRFLDAGSTGIFTLNQNDGTVSHVDPVTNTLVASIPVDPTGAVVGGDIAADATGVWARVSGNLVSQIDPATDTLVALWGSPAGSGGVALSETAVFVTAHDVNTVWHIARA